MVRVAIKDDDIAYSEYLKDGEGHIIVFKDKGSAIRFLENKGLDDEHIKPLVFEHFGI